MKISLPRNFPHQTLGQGGRVPSAPPESKEILRERGGAAKCKLYLLKEEVRVKEIETSASFFQFWKL